MCLPPNTARLAFWFWASGVADHRMPSLISTLVTARSGGPPMQPVEAEVLPFSPGWRRSNQTVRSDARGVTTHLRHTACRMLDIPIQSILQGVVYRGRFRVFLLP